MTCHLDFIQTYLTAMEQGVVGEAMAAFFTPDATHRQFPNRLVPNGSSTDLQGMLAAQVRGQTAVREQRYLIKSAIEQGDQVALELEWTGILLRPFGSLGIGATIKAYYALFVTFRDDKIAALRNYDCFEPF